MVLGLVGRDLLLDIAETVAREDAAAVFDLAARVVESGQDLKHVCRELARLVRDLMILQIDSRRTDDSDYAVDGDRARLDALARAFSREDLLRAFDLITKLEADLRFATQPRYHLEMALLRWIYLRRLVPIADLIDAVQKNAPLTSRPSTGTASITGSRSGGPSSSASSPPFAGGRATSNPTLVEKVQARTASPSPSAAPAPAAVSPAPVTLPPAAVPAPSPAAPATASPDSTSAPAQEPRAAVTIGPEFRDAFLAEIKRTKAKFTYNTLIASARRVEVSDGLVTFVFGARAATLQAQFEQLRASLEEIATAVAGRAMKVTTVEERDAAPAAGKPAVAAGDQERLKAAVMNEPAVQAMLDVFPAEIKDVEEM
jgi:DNA polymerase III subunit gamma/tau